MKKQRFTKAQLLESKQWREEKDLLAALLEDRPYTLAEAKALVDGFKKGKVK